ncbi:sterol desaturase family protein [Mucilaginibacter sp. SMC90]|uniref:sterol desaturase family protein n=1 Tax=Mucilaginibacter sp. SMC90 TaxID=2929803 RepID=UPI001FB27479|nr:sterol desaturase family protein [Mucilaginibacter sp. SMC90]UOE48839.1 sterol desaturase family protein [Mucilaginibacter sp. SMC90]
MTSVKKKFISNSEESVRMFKSGLLEALSKVHFTVPIYLFLPVIIYCCYRSAASAMLWWEYPPVLIIALIVWTLVEYVMHRYVFHFELPGTIGRRLHFIIHGVHHDYPSDRLRLVMPPSLSIPLAFGFFSLFRALLPARYFWFFFAIFLVGYLVYDIGHYAMHHFNFKSGIFKKIKQHHMRHHYQEPEKGYGVSSPLWDHITGSLFSKNTSAGPYRK